MQKVIAFIILLLITTVAAGGYLSWQVSEHYQQAQLEVLTELNNNLSTHNMQLICNSQAEWLGLKYYETCTLERLNRPLVLLEIWQTVLITPLWVQGSFGIIPEKGFVIDFFNLQSLFNEQEGRWYLPYGQQDLEFSYHTGTLNNNTKPGTEIKVSPLKFNGSINVNAPYKSQISIQIPELKFEQLSQKLHLKDFNFNTNGFKKKQVHFLERSDISFKTFELATGGRSLSINHLSAKQANIVDTNKLASLNNIEFESLRIHSDASDIRFDSNKLYFYLDNLDWSIVNQLSALTKINQVPSVKDLESLLSTNIHVSLDRLETNFIYQDRTSALLGASGDIKVKGDLRLLATDNELTLDHLEQRIKAKLKLNLSNSLMLGPHAGLMMDFVEEGWLYQRGNRLVGNIYYANGKLLSNGNIVSSLALLPVFEEDH